MNPHDSDTTAETAKTEAPMPLGRMIAYGAPGFAGAGMAIPIGVLMPVFYSDVVMAPLGTIALAIAIAARLSAAIERAGEAWLVVSGGRTPQQARLPGRRGGTKYTSMKSGT